MCYGLLISAIIRREQRVGRELGVGLDAAVTSVVNLKMEDMGHGGPRRDILSARWGR